MEINMITEERTMVDMVNDARPLIVTFTDHRTGVWVMDKAHYKWEKGAVKGLAYDSRLTLGGVRGKLYRVVTGSGQLVATVTDQAIILNIWVEQVADDEHTGQQPIKGEDEHLPRITFLDKETETKLDVHSLSVSQSFSVGAIVQLATNGKPYSYTNAVDENPVDRYRVVEVIMSMEKATVIVSQEQDVRDIALARDLTMLFVKGFEGSSWKHLSNPFRNEMLDDWTTAAVPEIKRWRLGL